MYLSVGADAVFFNAVDIGSSNGTKGNGATDVRTTYTSKWSDFESLKSRIIVAGAGGHNEKKLLVKSLAYVSFLGTMDTPEA